MKLQDLKHRALYKLTADVKNPFGDKRNKYDVGKRPVIEADTMIRVRVELPDPDPELLNVKPIGRIDLQTKKASGYWDSIVVWFFADGEPIEAKYAEDEPRRAFWLELIANLEALPYDVDAVYSELGIDNLNITRAALQRMVNEGKLALVDLKAALEAELASDDE